MYVPALSEAEPRLQRRYHQLIVSPLSSAQRLAAGVHAPPTLVKGFATTQAAWRFYANERVTLPGLCSPLIEHAGSATPGCCSDWVLVIADWSNLHYPAHASKAGRIELSGKNDLGYEMFTLLAASDRDGVPIAPLCLELRAQDGTHTTRHAGVLKPLSPLDALEQAMCQTATLPLGKPPVFVIDREADSVGHYRRWDASGKKFIVRANSGRKVLHDGKELRLDEVAGVFRHRMKPVRSVLYKGKPAEQFIAETLVVLHRPARQHRLDRRSRKLKHKNLPGPRLPLRLIVSEMRDCNGKLLARWLLLSNLPGRVFAATIAL